MAAFRVNGELWEGRAKALLTGQVKWTGCGAGSGCRKWSSSLFLCGNRSRNFQSLCKCLQVWDHSPLRRTKKNRRIFLKLDHVVKSLRCKSRWMPSMLPLLGKEKNSVGRLVTHSDLANVVQLWDGPSLLSSPVRAPDVRLPDHLKILSYGFVLFCFFWNSSQSWFLIPVIMSPWCQAPKL